MLVFVTDLGNKETREIFGVSKIKNGNRYEIVHLGRICFVLYPAKKEAMLWNPVGRLSSGCPMLCSNAIVGAVDFQGIFQLAPANLYPADSPTIGMTFQSQLT